MARRRIAFLLGSGVSLPAGMPGTEDLTNFVLDEVNSIWDDGAESFTDIEPGGGESSWLAKRQKMCALLTHVQQYCEAVFNSQQRTSNYEDLYYLLSQLDEHLAGEYENPIVESFVMDLRTWSRDCLRATAGRLCRYIEWTVGRKLTCHSKGDHLRPLIDALSDTHFHCDVFTLNHDKLIEGSLERAGIPYVDGFGPRNGDVAWWQPDGFSNPAHPCLLKLHGSIDWFRYDRRLAKAVGDDPYHARTAQECLLPIPKAEPVLIGTFNKIREYSLPPYCDLFTTFRQRLGRPSLGDKGVNTILVAWMREQIPHEDRQGVIDNARDAIRALHRTCGHRVDIHPKYPSKCGWDELARRLTL